jgi:hypothetical protein
MITALNQIDELNVLYLTGWDLHPLGAISSARHHYRLIILGGLHHAGEYVL